ncbi:MAG: hypothetical protein AAFZ65_20970 [Planctomycetota bacterium]
MRRRPPFLECLTLFAFTPFAAAFQSNDFPDLLSPSTPVPTQGPERIELFPWEDPLTGWEPYQFSFLVRARGLLDADDPFGEEDVRGFFLEDARVAISGALSDSVNYRFTFDAGDEGERDSGELELLEGWAAFDLGATQHLTFGRFRRPFLRSSIVDQSTLAFFDRTVSGDLNNVYDDGVRVDGRYELVDLTFAIQNGADATGDELRTTARAELQLLGGGVPLEDALYRIERTQQLSVGLAYADDTGLTSGDSIAIDAAWRYSRFGLSGELLSNAEDVGDSRPWAIAAQWLPLPEEWVVGARFQDYDDANDTQVLSALAKRYLVRGRIAGHFQIDLVETRNDFTEGWLFTVGTTLTF